MPASCRVEDAPPARWRAPTTPGRACAEIRMDPCLRGDDVASAASESDDGLGGMSREHEPTAGNVRPSGRGGRILPFRRKMPALRTTQQPITDPIRQFEDEEDRRRMQQNLAAAVVIILVIVSGFWLIDH